MKVISIVGARPQFIKATLVSKALKQAGQEDFILHTGQHYDFGMSRVFFSELGIPEPDVNLNIGSRRHGEQTGEMLAQIEKVLSEQKPDCAIVYGDTNSTLAGALAASKLHVPVAHVEAGLRSYNKYMPEEQNRVLTDHLSSVLFCPTANAVQNLGKEGFKIGIPERNPSCNSPAVIQVGDVMYDTVLFYGSFSERHSDLLTHLQLIDDRGKVVPYALCTVHRAENTDSKKRLGSILSALDQLSHQVPIIMPLHPRTLKTIQANQEFQTLTKSLQIIEPVSYLQMLLLEKNSTLICTDSGGVQKEAYFFKKPCITMRNQTEWVETVTAGWNQLTGAETERIIRSFNIAISGSGSEDDLPPFSKSPGDRLAHFGDGNAAQLMVDYLVQCIFKS